MQFSPALPYLSVNHDKIVHLHKSYNARVPYPAMHNFVTEMYTHVHISVIKWCIVGYLSIELWDVWYVFITTFRW